MTMQTDQAGGARTWHHGSSDGEFRPARGHPDRRVGPQSRCGSSLRIERGAEVAGGGGPAVQAVDVVITMVTDAKAVTSIVIGLGMLEALPSGAVWAQMSTIGVEATEAIAATVERRRPDVSFLDAPVSGSKVPAEQGRLTIFASGSERRAPRSSLSSPPSDNAQYGSGRSARVPG